MEVLSAAGLSSAVSLHKSTASSSEKRSEPKRFFQFKLTKLAAFSSVLGASSLAKGLTYEEALNQSVNASSFSSSDFDVSGFLDGIVSFSTENPLIIGGGALLLALPLILSQILKKPKNWGVESASNAFAKLSEDAGAQLLDIRDGRDFKEVGSPDVRSLKKKAVAITYRRNDKPGFLKKLELKFKDPTNTTLFILDKFDGESELVAELVTVNGFKAAYAIKDGAEGTRGWMNSGLPWSPPKKTLNINYEELTDAIASAIGEGSDGLPVTLGLAAATGLGIFAFTEIETILQLLGSAALIQFVTKKLLFAEDRKVTLQQTDEFLNTKVAPKEFVDEIKMIGKAFLPSGTSAMASLPAPAEGDSTTSTTSTPIQNADAVLAAKPKAKVESSTEPPPAVNSVPKAEVKEESLSGISRPLSPYPYYPDLKPPASPSPSAP